VKENEKAPAAARPVRGQTVWLYDENRRHYSESVGGKPRQLIYAEHWRETTVVKSGRINLTLATGHTLRKREDGTTGAAYSGSACYVVFTREEVDAITWRETHAHRLVDAIRACRDVAVLKQIAALVGYDEQTNGGA
jgi:hypothetical protein